MGWLRKGKVVDRFLNLITEIKEFLEQKGESNHKLEDPNWLGDLIF